MAITDRMIKETYLEPGGLRYYLLHDLKRAAEGVEWNDWGICEYECHVWAGVRVAIEGKDILRLTLLDVLEKRDEQYPEWGDEEVYLQVKIDEETGEFTWFLKNQEEFKETEAEYADEK
ncbi:MAG: hypothetical protein Q8L52_02540 [bacterium]|nr:hypothetical protein [bacterium]